MAHQAHQSAAAAAVPYGRTQSTVWGPFELHSKPSKRPGSRAGAGITTTSNTTNVSTGPTGVPSPSPVILEVSLHTPLPKPLQREVRHVFSGMIMDAAVQGEGDICVAIPTNQRATVDLVSMRGDAVEAEKDRLLNVFMDFASSVCRDIAAANYWADFIDPCSGLPMLTRHCNKVYSEVDGMECCLGYRSYSAGFCKVLEHPVWGTAVYPATIFSNAPKEILIGILEQYRIT